MSLGGLIDLPTFLKHARHPDRVTAATTRQASGAEHHPQAKRSTHSTYLRVEEGEKGGLRCRTAGWSRQIGLDKPAVPDFDQYWSELRTTPSFLARTAIQMAFEIEFLMNLTLPSPKPTFTPPGCILRLWPPLLYMPPPQLKPMPC